MNKDFLLTLKGGLGWFYFVCWSSTFYPQIFLNARPYAVFTIFGFSLPIVREAFIRERGAAPPIETADVLFAAHALVMCTLWLAQIMALPPGVKMRRDVTISCFSTLVLLFVTVLATWRGYLSWVFALNFCGFVKVMASIIKHFPQIYSNYKRKRTTGFSATMIILDVAGSLGSFAQQGVRCVIDQSWEPFIGNPSKLFLALESLAFDLFFLFQAFVLYRHNNKEDPTMPRYTTLANPDHSHTR